MERLIPIGYPQHWIGAQLRPQLLKCHLPSFGPLKPTILPKQLSDRNRNFSIIWNQLSIPSHVL